MKAGDVRGVRELTRGVQAEVCLGADTMLGYATIRIEARSPRALDALAALKDALKDEAQSYVGAVLEGQAAWDKEMGK